MKDKNTVIGFTLMGIMLVVLFWFNNKDNQARAIANEQKAREDSIAKARSITPEQKRNDSLDKVRLDSTSKIDGAGDFGSTAGIGKEELVTVENELMKVAFTNKGGRVKFVTLKNYKSFDSSLVTLGSTNDKLGYAVKTGRSSAQTNDLYFTPSAVVKNADGSQSITFNLKDSAGSRSVSHIFTIKPNDYMVDWNVDIKGANQLLNGSLNINWHVETLKHERSAKYENQMSNVCFAEDKEFDYISMKTERKFEKPVQWLGAVQQFFNTTLITKQEFATGEVKWARHTVDTSQLLGTVDANLQAKVSGSSVSVPLQVYYGPNDYKVLKAQTTAPEMDKIINLGRDMYSFVRPINKYIIMPVFNFFASFVSNYGWVILLLTLFIRLLTAPLTYGSYLNGAKMKILRPELDELKKKYKDDQQGFAMAQMQFNKEAGVNMLGGCLPALLQIPIFFALYSFFNSNIALRGQEFLWSKDLSAFDTIISWKTEIWGLSWALNNHISLFTITAVITSFLISIYNMSMTPTQDNPALKYMPYIFPFILFFVFNGLPSALTWYYTVSNIITLALQFVIQNYIINHDKIVANIEERRKAPKKGPSKWQERMQQMQETQKKMQDMKNRSQNKK